MAVSRKVGETCRAFVRGLRRILGAKLHGLYVHGAAVFPGGERVRDIDFHAVLADSLTGDEKSGIEEMHDSLGRDFPPLGAEMDGYYILLEDARRADPPRSLMWSLAPDESWALHRAHILAGRFIAFHGPDPKEIFPVPAWPEIELALDRELLYVERHLEECPDYGILQLFRLTYSFETGDVVVSKAGAAAWASAAMPDWRRHAELALKSYDGLTRPEDADYMRSDAGRLLECARGRIRQARGAAAARFDAQRPAAWGDARARSGGVFEPPEGLEFERLAAVEGYRRWAPSYDGMLTDTVDGPILGRFLGEIPKTDGMLLLDFGCGTGRNAAWLRDRGYRFRAVGVDVSRDMLALAERKGLYERLVEGDFPDLEGGFDLALCVLASCHIADLGKLYGYVSQRLKGGGHFMLVDMHPHMFCMGKGTFVPIEGRTVYIENYVHSQNDHARCGTGSGLVLREIDESFAPQEWAAKSGTYEKLAGHPLGIGYLWARAPV